MSVGFLCKVHKIRLCTKKGKIVNLYDYMGELSDDALYYPTDFSLLTDFFIKNMPADDYDTWISSFSQISLDNNK